MQTTPAVVFVLLLSTSVVSSQVSTKSSSHQIERQQIFDYLSSSSSSSPNVRQQNLLKNVRAKRSLATWEDGADCDAKLAAIYALRCDEGAEMSDGMLTVKANEPTQVMLIGNKLDLNLSVALTPTAGSPRDDCTHTDRIKTLHIQNVSSSIAYVIIDLPSSGPTVPLYLCLRETKDGAGWFHQGSDPWLTIYIRQDLLPLYMKLIVILALLLLSGLFSGLNLGLMALDKNELAVIISCGSETEKRYASAIETVRRREELTSGIVAVMTSTISIVLLGEILPQAFCSRHGLAVGAKTVSITYFCMIVTFPLSYPVSSCLDWILGEEIGHAYDRERLMEFIRVTRDYNNLEMDEVNIISGALKLKRIQLKEIMTKIEDVYMLDVNSALDFDTIQAIIEKGYSRVPVHEAGNKKNIVALLFAKDLALLDPDDKTPVQTMISFYNHPMMYLFEDTTLDLALNEFKTGKSHMAFVQRIIDEGDKDPVYEITGVVTLEDVIEEIMQMEINDETDTLTDNRRKRRRKEAQVRRDFSQFTNLGAGDASYNVVTPQLCLVAYQYLATNVDAFSPKVISDCVLRRLLSHKIYHKVRVTDNHTERRLYTLGEPCDYFIMILEGRVHVTCGKENLVFDGGPFSYFGKAALSQQPAAPGSKTCSLTSPATGQLNVALPIRKSSAQKAPEFEQPIKESIFGKTLNDHLSISMKRLEQLPFEPESNNMSLTSYTGSLAPVRLKTSESRASIQSLIEKSTTTHFIPDYTVEIVADTSYLKITRAEYQSAIKATLVERGGGPIVGGGDDESTTAISEVDLALTNQQQQGPAS